MEYIKHFVKHTHCSPENKCLLILDGHKSHTKNIDLLNYACEKGLYLLSLPPSPHTSHKLQPLDRSVFKSLRSHYNSVCSDWLRRHLARRISIDEIGELFCQAYVKSATIENAAAGFRASGIYPFNRNILPDTDFLQDPRVSSDDVSPLTTPDIDTSSSVSVVPSLEPPTSNLPSTPSNAEADAPQSTVHFDVSTQDDSNANKSIENTSPSFADILPVPQLKAKQSKRKGEQGNFNKFTI